MGSSGSIGIGSVSIMVGIVVGWFFVLCGWCGLKGFCRGWCGLKSGYG